jgi:ABC-type branched-subunit amino acid transport system permease subunit
MARWRPYFLGLLGVAAITFPFLWLQLQPNFTDNTIQTVWAPDPGLQFFSDLLPVFLVGLLIWLGVRANRFWHLSDALARTAVWQGADKTWSRYWAWIAMPLVLCGTFGFGPSNLTLMTDAGIYMLLALGLNITVGMTGLLVLGYAGFYAFGAYFFAIAQHNVSFFPWWIAAPLAFPLGGLMGYLLGLPCLRLRGDYLAIVTLGFAEAFRETIRNLEFTGGDQGISIEIGNKLRGFAGVSHQQVAYLVVALVLFLAVFFVQRLYHSPIGRAWIAIRENEIAAASVGVPVVQMKLLAFSLSAAIAAVAGVLYGAKASSARRSASSANRSRSSPWSSLAAWATPTAFCSAPRCSSSCRHTSTVSPWCRTASFSPRCLSSCASPSCTSPTTSSCFSARSWSS